MNKLWQALRQRHIVRNALRVALVVGTVLNVINQGDAIFNGGPISWLHVALNFVVPYCVASYSAAKNEINPRRNDEER